MSPQTKNIEKKVIENYDIANSYETLHLAQDLARFIKENKLFHNIQGKAYVNVEGWQYAGARLGIVPVIEALTNYSTGEKEIKYQALVKLFDLKSQQTVGSGFAICSNLENGKRNYQEFAIASMAQTRAIGKAYRNILAWIIRAAGYEPTPAEEMDYMSKDEAAPIEKEKRADRAPLSLEKSKQEIISEKLASVKQKTEILLLLNNKVITKDEKNKMIENINDLNEVRATQAIARLKKVIKDRDVTSQTV
ncbi:hypothetical protein [Catalinimonas niigatensis]|uniref:hypothetical protein n=1 Tax=Catalinimonas niigatensis TaxID=1397264 RepID=UPI002665A1C6|nr:hypothetical protein [Catalinimonas niigatensis]WPP50861.1 hypothetical protein PZB72_00445 [Catalinimonas niigatensis]